MLPGCLLSLSIIKSCQKAFAQGDTERFRHLRNITDHERKLCRGKYYATKFVHLKTTKPSQGWRGVKKIAGVARISILREYADFLTAPVCDILNSSFAEQKLPRSWKDADVSLLMKVKPVTIITKHIRPMSLTPALSKLAVKFVVSKYIGPAVLELIDPNKLCAIPKSSTLHALISMVHS